MNWKLTTAIGAGLLTFFAVRNRRQQTRRTNSALDYRVNTASDESFPASDPPSYTPTGGATAY